MSASDGARSRSLHESPALTPPFLPAPGRWFAFGEIFPVLSSNCCDFAVTRPAGPMTPAVPCAVTSLPDAAEELCLTGAGALAGVLLPPPPPQPTTAIIPARRPAGIAVLTSLRIRLAGPFMPRGLSVIG